MNRICKNCSELLDISMFYRNSPTSYQWKCKRCHCNSKRRNKDKEYKPHSKIYKSVEEDDNPFKTYKRKKKDFKEQIIIDNDKVYDFLKRIENNGLKIDYIDALRLIDAYLNVFGNDLPDYYTECQQFDIMFFRLNKYILKINEKK